MRSRIFQTCAGRLACLLCSPLFILLLAAGCDASKTKYQTEEVSGKVLFKKKGLQGGRVTFVADEGGMAAGANIDENGNYKVLAPVGPVHITVDNRMLQNRAVGRGPLLHNPEKEDPSAPKGRYVDIPTKYYSAQNTTLTFTVEPGAAQVHDISLE